LILGVHYTIKKELGNLPEISEEYPYFSDESREIKLTKQFIWLHVHVNNEIVNSNEKNV
jgi:hypothetical protein